MSEQEQQMSDWTRFNRQIQIPYEREPSPLVRMLESIMRRDAFHRQYNHTFEALERGVHPGERTLNCPCGNSRRIPMPHEKHCELQICPNCQSWHTILWRGEKSREEIEEDREIRMKNLDLPPTQPSWLSALFEKTKKSI